MALKAQNTISVKEGRLFLDGEEMALIKRLKPTWRKINPRSISWGRRMTGHKTTRVNGTGIATFYKVTPQFVLIMMDYVKREMVFTSLYKLFWMTHLQGVALNESSFMMWALILLKLQERKWYHLPLRTSMFLSS